MAVPTERDGQPEDGVTELLDACQLQRRLPRWDDFIAGYSSGPLASTLDPRARLRFTEQRKKQRQQE